MATNLAIDSSLIETARVIGRHKTKRAAVIEALNEYILRRKQLGVLEFFDKVDYDREYNFKKQRKKP